jgi:hypothetical protein
LKNTSLASLQNSFEVNSPLMSLLASSPEQQLLIQSLLALSSQQQASNVQALSVLNAVLKELQAQNLPL